MQVKSIHSSILSTFIKLPFVIKVFVLSILGWPFYICFTVVSLMDKFIIYSNKKDASDFYGTVSFDPIKMSQQNIYQNVYQTSDTQKLVII